MRITWFLCAFTCLFSVLGVADSIPYRRFEPSLIKLREALSKSDTADKAVTHLGNSDIRGVLFRLEGLLRFYEKHDKLADMAEKVKAEIKAFEDASGAYDENAMMAKLVPELKAPDAVVKYFQESEKAAQASFVRFLRRKDWIPLRKGGALDEIESRLTKAKWDGNKDDREFLLERFEKWIKKVDKNEYDLTELESGIHELRRDLRWISIIAQATDGLIQLKDKCDYPALAPLLKDKVAESPFAKLPASPHEKKPCYVSKCAYLAVVKAVGDLGAIKDTGQVEEFLVTGIEDGKLETGGKTARAYAKKLMENYKPLVEHPEYKNVTAAATKVYSSFQKADALGVLKDEVQDCQK